MMPAHRHRPTPLTRIYTKQLRNRQLRRMNVAADCLERPTFTVLSNPGTSGAVIGSE
jgi:hypothetical protein